MANDLRGMNLALESQLAITKGLESEQEIRLGPATLWGKQLGKGKA